MWKPDGKGFYYVGAPQGVANLYEYDFATKKSTQRTQFDDDGVVYPGLVARRFDDRLSPLVSISIG